MPSQQPVSNALTHRHGQSGATLVEVLVAVLVLAIGFMGMAALQMQSLSTNNSAMARSMATIATYSILDSMRTDPAGVTAGNYNTTVTANNCPGVGTLAKDHLNAWCEELAENLGALSSTTGTVNCTAIGDCTVTIQFDDSRSGPTGSATQKISVKARI